MNPKSHPGWVLALAVVLAAGVPGCNKLKARDMLNKGVGAYKQSKFDQAIEDFKQAKDLDPKLLTARLYLATAYASLYIPGAPSEENIRLGQQAVEEFQEVLQENPKNLSAIDGIGSILFYMGGGPPYDAKKLEESKAYHEKHIQLKPDDPEPYYRVGVIDWTLAYRANKELRLTFNERARKPLKDEDPLPLALRDQFMENYGKTVQEGIDALHRAIEVRPDYDDAMAYLNLLYRQKADMETTAEARDDDLHQADMLVDRVKEIKQKKMEAPPPKS
jgi:tetratricopeptide (TPR) repeat protein